jgi:osmotically-inducible protein OsmY
MKSDLELKHDVEAEIGCDRSIQPATIGVEVSNGVVTLSGHPASYAAKIAAQRATARVAGVRGIVVEMDVGVPRQLVYGAAKATPGVHAIVNLLNVE